MPAALADLFTLVAVFAVLSLVLSACGRSGPVAPRDEQGKPLAVDNPDRYLPPKLQGVKIGKLAPIKRAEVEAQTDAYGLGGWASSYVGATANLSSTDLSRAFVSIVRTTGPDPDLAPRVAFYGSGSGTIDGLRSVDIDGEPVQVGTVVNGQGEFPFAVWSPAPDTTVAVTMRGTRGDIDMDPETSMRQLIEWSKK